MESFLSLLQGGLLITILLQACALRGERLVDKSTLIKPLRDAAVDHVFELEVSELSMVNCRYEILR